MEKTWFESFSWAFWKPDCNTACTLMLHVDITGTKPKLNLKCGSPWLCSYRQSVKKKILTETCPLTTCTVTQMIKSYPLLDSHSTSMCTYPKICVQFVCALEAFSVSLTCNVPRKTWAKTCYKTYQSEEHIVGCFPWFSSSSSNLKSSSSWSFEKPLV